MQQLLHRGAAVTQRRTDEVLDASWDDLKSFLVCTRYKSFRNAAEALGLTSTTLMRRIDRLEDRIGCKLFLRDQSGLTVSEEGLAMIGDASEMERYAFNIFRRAFQSSKEPAGTVRVAVTEGPPLPAAIELTCVPCPSGSIRLVVPDWIIASMSAAA